MQVATLSRLRRFVWDRFLLVGRHAMLAYTVIAGLLAFVFVEKMAPAADHSRSPRPHSLSSP